jgi:hypothetical protein
MPSPGELQARRVVGFVDADMSAPIALEQYERYAKIFCDVQGVTHSICKMILHDKQKEEVMICYYELIE